MGYIKKKNKIPKLHRILEKPISRTLESAYLVYKEQFLKQGFKENQLLTIEEFIKESADYLKITERG